MTVPEEPTVSHHPQDPGQSLATGQPPPPSSDAGGARRVSRRTVLAGAGAIGAAGVVAGLGTWQPWKPATRPSGTVGTGGAGSGAGIAVVITLYGGNDGLNTVVPASDPAYVSGRPTLGYHPSEVLPLTDGLGLNPKLVALKRHWDAGRLAVVRGVGYPDPSLSHFQSMDIWQTATATGVGPGWLGRWLDLTGSDPMRAISLGSSLPPALRGERSAATAITSGTIRLPGRAPLVAGFSACSAPAPDRSPLAGSVSASAADLLKVRSTLSSLTGDRLAVPSPPTTAVAAGPATPGARTSGTFSAQMATVATLINAGAPTTVYQVSLASFDTHADEKAGHERLLAELDAGIDTLLSAVGSGPRSQDVVAFTVSEFGRRVAENASGGTDHGTAAPVLVAGHAVKGGRLYGDEPPLDALDGSGNLRYAVDFRSVYATMLERVIGVDPQKVLGGTFTPLDLL